MKATTFITTSWDDGHPSDLRIAELLAKHSLPGTFYVPRSTEYGTMSAAQLREISDNFEVGGHTLGHVEMTRATREEARQEISGCKAWLEDQTGRDCFMFCPPKGKFARGHLDLIRDAGFSGVRTVELLSLDSPRPAAGLLVMPTTVQAHPHGFGAYARNAARRAAFRNLWLYLLHGRTTDWQALTRRLLTCAVRHGGVFHLWGHSWELNESGHWQRLEEALRLMAEFAPSASALNNGEVCRAVTGGPPPAWSGPEVGVVR